VEHPDLVTFCVTTTGRVRLWSPGAAALFGRGREEVLGLDLCDAVLDGEHREAFDTAMRSAAAGTACTRSLPVRLAGGTVPVELHWEPMLDDTGDITVAVSAIPRPAGPRPAPSPERGVLRIGATLDLRPTARELTDVLVDGVCDGVAVYVLERLLIDDQAPLLWAGESRVVVRRVAINAASGPVHEWRSAFPVDEVVAYAAGTPYARCMNAGRPVFFADLDSQTLGRLKDRAYTRPRAAEVLGYHSFLVVPLIARGTALGFVVLARRPPREPFRRGDADFACEVAEHAAMCIDNARLYQRERRTTRTLQRSLLPVKLPTPPGMRIVHRYLPAAQISRVGGDWYDAIPLPGGQVALVVGDAMGHGTTAALVMGQLRTAIRILARLGLPPAELMCQLDQIAQDLTTTQFATCIYAVCDPTTRTLTIARAGHIPPILAHHDGTTQVIDLPPGLPLGVGGATYEASQVPMPVGSTLILCTDGLVEDRVRDLDSGIAMMRKSLAETASDPDDRCDAILETLRTSTSTDDATLLLARIEA
jgi:PAS domain S-box-containing protein